MRVLTIGKMRHLAAFIVIGILTPGSGVFAQSVIWQSEPYRKCAELLKSNPSGALVFSERWVKIEPSPSSLHCRGLVLFEQQRFREAGEVLDRLSESLKMASTTLRIGVYRQSSRAWQRAGDFSQAVERLGEALALMNPERVDAVAQRQQVEILMDRALLRNEMKKPLESIQDLDQALTYDILKDRVLLTRAKIESSNGQKELAVKDIQEILKDNPHHEEARELLKAIVEQAPK